MTMDDTGNLKSYGKGRGLQITSFLNHTLRIELLQDIKEIVCSFEELWLEKHSLQNFLATFKIQTSCFAL